MGRVEIRLAVNYAMLFCAELGSPGLGCQLWVSLKLKVCADTLFGVMPGMSNYSIDAAVAAVCKRSCTGAILSRLMLSVIDADLYTLR